MKKKVIAVLLASMMATSMVPVTAMAEDQPLIESTEDAQDLAEEAETEGEAEDVFAEENEAEEADAEETEDLEQSEDALEISQEAADPFGLSDGTAVFSDEERTVTINGVSFDTTKTYIVPLTLKNAHNLDQDSAAVACPGKFGTLTFEADGTAKISTNLRSVTVGTLTDYAYDFKVYQGVKPSGDTVAADVVATQNVSKADGSGNHDVPETISFTIPKDTYSNNGVYLSMYVDAMGYAPDAFLQIDYAEKKESGDPSLNFTTEVSTAEVEQFGNYNVTSQVTVKDGRITDVALAGNDFKGTHADDNQMYLNKAINGLGSTKGMKEKLTGLYMNDAQKLNDLDTVTGATYSSNAIKNATMNALGVKIEQEVIPDAPSEKPAAGLYYIEMKDRTDVVDHGLVGESKKAGAYLRVDDAGKMWLTYKMVSGTTGELLYVLGYNGYYPNGDTSKALSMEGVTYSTEKMTAPTIGDCSVVTDITVPLDGISQTYVNNVSLYVEAMKNLNGEVSGVNFDHGKFNINSTITLYWDTLDNLSEGTNATKLATLSDGVYKLNGQMVKVNKVDMSMSNNAINHNVKLVMKDGLPYISMNFNSLTVGSLKGYLKDLNYYATGYTVSKTGEPSGTLLPVQVDSLQKFSNGKTLKDDFGTNYPNDVTFPLCQEAMTEENGEYVPMQVFVPIMDAITAGTGKQNVYLKLDYSTLKKTTADDKDFAETEKAPTDPSAIKAQTITVTVKNTKGVVSKKYGDKAFYLGAKAKTGLTYKSSNTKIATVDSKGKVTIKGVGTVKITITAKASTSYKAATKTMTIKVAKATPVLKTKITSKAISYSALRKKSQVFTLGASTSSKGTLTYAKVSGSSAFTVNKTNGKITVKKGLKKGTYKVKVKIYSKATTRYNAGSKTVLVTVKVK
jgi:major membrane immunogen (membrane-anchored lipoprotein)